MFDNVYAVCNFIELGQTKIYLSNYITSFCLCNTKNDLVKNEINTMRPVKDSTQNIFLMPIILIHLLFPPTSSIQ